MLVRGNIMPKASVPKAMQATYDIIVGLTDAFCEQHLNKEYAELCRKVAGVLSRKRPSPLARGKPSIWACAIVYTIGRVNFLFDPSQTPHVSAARLCELFGVSQSSASAKAKVIWDMLKLMPFHPDWTLRSRMDSNPLVWMLSVNGLIMDVRAAPREVQEIAFAKGLIPYIPENPPEDDE
jgi:hypothetical protein